MDLINIMLSTSQLPSEDLLINIIRLMSLRDTLSLVTGINTCSFHALKNTNQLEERTVIGYVVNYLVKTWLFHGCIMEYVAFIFKVLDL